MNNKGLEALFECINIDLNREKFYKMVRENTIDNQFILYSNFK